MNEVLLSYVLLVFSFFFLFVILFYFLNLSIFFCRYSFSRYSIICYCVTLISNTRQERPQTYPNHVLDTFNSSPSAAFPYIKATPKATKTKAKFYLSNRHSLSPRNKGRVSFNLFTAFLVFKYFVRSVALYNRPYHGFRRHFDE